MNENIYKKIESIRNEIKPLVNNIDELKRTLMLECNRCNKKSQIKNWTLKQTYYVRDGGYCIGDEVVRGKIECYCPKCNKYQWFNWNQKDKEKELEKFISENTRYFKELIDDHGKSLD